MQAVWNKNRTSLHSIDDSVLKTRGSLSMGSGGHVRKRRRGSLSFGISINLKHQELLGKYNKRFLLYKFTKRILLVSDAEYRFSGLTFSFDPINIIA